ncbi:hypothetical protein NSP_43380 [Nodularia spumigena CCY9414]|jgi:hypothetical protein|nr:hypothetical protein NSP_43380 [Nodularia spumigena CCY9414]
MGRRNTVRIIVSDEAIMFAGTRNAQMLVQLLRENSAKALKSSINLVGLMSTSEK